MILIIGTSDDPTTIYFSNFLQEQKASYLFLNLKFLLQGIDISNETLCFFGKYYSLSCFSGVLNRLASIKYTGAQQIPAKYYRCFDVLTNIIDTFLPNVLNPGFLGFSNDSKLFQSISIKTNSIKIPQSCVLGNLNVRENLRTVSTSSNHIIKSLSSIRSIVQHFEKNTELFLDRSREPVLFQELVEGIIDEVCIAIMVYSDTLDYRYGKSAARGEVHALPTEIQQDCILISKQLQLRFCGIDLIMKNDEYYFLEANPAPGWSYFECMINNKDITYALFRTLAQK